MATAILPSPAQNSVTQLISESDAAEILGLQPDTLRRWRAKSRGPSFHRFGREIRYSARDLEAFIARARITHSGE